ncbi:ABC-type nitrate/sulfonate/bicarbonate transport system permease component [Bradyrhizobium sp. AZCC 2262]|uniref:ABC transporter permease n=1 Tax=Bradyrhizobium sp. AZCC 2262 TaxID=3117022 RepID=UPI002FEFE494
MTVLNQTSRPPAIDANKRIEEQRRSLGWSHRLRQEKRLYGLALIAALLILWEASVRLGWVVSSYWPPVSVVFLAALRGLAGGDIALTLLATLRRGAIGYASGSVAGITLGLLLGVNRWLRYLIRPIIEVIRPIPAPAVIPPLILFLGVDDALKIFIVALASFFPVFTNAFSGVQAVDDTLVQTARTFRVGWYRTMMKVILPATLPPITAGLRSAISIALVVAVIAEMIAGSSGIGYFIVEMQYAMRPDQMYAAIIYLAATGYILNRLFLAVEARLIPWMGKV